MEVSVAATAGHSAGGRAITTPLEAACAAQTDGEQFAERPRPLALAATARDTAMRNHAADTYTLDEALDACCAMPSAFILLLVLYCGLAMLCDAMEVMVLSYTAPSAACMWDLSATQQSLVISMVFLGQMLGEPFWGMVADIHGRKTALCYSMAIAASFGAGSAAAPNFQALMALRALVGFTVSGGNVLALNLMLEWAPTSWRGVLVVAVQGFWPLGTLLQAGLSFAFLNSSGWRVLVAISAIPLVILLLLLPLVPESPRYLLVKGQAGRAEQLLKQACRIAGKQLPPGKLHICTSPGSNTFVPTEPVMDPTLDNYWSARSVTVTHGIDHKPTSLQLLKKAGAIASERLQSGWAISWTVLRQLLSRPLGQTTVVLLVLFMLMGCIYNGLVLLVSNSQTLNFGSNTDIKACVDGKLTMPAADLLAVLITASAEIPGILVSLAVVHYLPRKAAFILPALAIAAALIPSMAGTAGVALIVCMSLARLSIYVSWNTLWVIAPESYPTSVRATGTTFTSSLCNVGSMVSPFIAVNAAQQAHIWVHAPAAIFLALALAAALLMLLLPGQGKKGHCLEDVTDIVQSQQC